MIYLDDMKTPPPKQKTMQMPDFLQNDFITGSLKVDGAVSIVDPVKQIIGKELLWGQVSGVEQ